MYSPRFLPTGSYQGACIPCLTEYLEHLMGMQFIGHMRCWAVIVLEEFRKRAETRVQKPRMWGKN